MSRRTIKMHEFRQALILMRKGKSNREIARLGVLSRNKSKELKGIASAAGWLTSTEMPTDATIYETLCKNKNISSIILPFIDKLEKWFNQGVTAVVAYRTLKEQFNFSGSYNCVQRYMKTL